MAAPHVVLSDPQQQGGWCACQSMRTRVVYASSDCELSLFAAHNGGGQKRRFFGGHVGGIGHSLTTPPYSECCLLRAVASLLWMARLWPFTI